MTPREPSSKPPRTDPATVTTAQDAAMVAAMDAAIVAAIVAIDPARIGGLSLRAQPGPARDHLLANLVAMTAGPVRKLPANIAPDRLLGGIDLPATLAAGAPRHQRGVLAEAHGGLVILAMAERIPAATAAHIAQTLDRATVERGTADPPHPARFGTILLDEGLADEHPAPALLDRVAIHLDLASLDHTTPRDLTAARALLPQIAPDDEAIAALCAAAAALGVNSARAPLLALRVAEAAAALDGRTTLSRDDLALAARLVLTPRATQRPAPPETGQTPETQPQPQDGSPSDTTDAPTAKPEATPLADQVLEAARAAIPPGLLAMLQQPRTKARTPGQSGAPVRGARGRPLPARQGLPSNGARLDLIETLRAAAPWQRLRGGGLPIKLRRDDLRIRRRQQRAETTTIFLVDASGSLALNRLAEAKGAVELLLADCYIRRDQVAVLAFRGSTATLLLPPTRSLVRAKRSLAALPGGGGTPLATALHAGADLADAIRRRGGSPTLVLLTDGQANVARTGKGGRPQARADALAAATRLRAAGHPTLMIDTSPRPNPDSRTLADTMAARYLALPYADARTVSRSVRALT